MQYAISPVTVRARTIWLASTKNSFGNLPTFALLENKVNRVMLSI